MGFTECDECQIKHDRNCISLRYKPPSPLGELHISENEAMHAIQAGAILNELNTQDRTNSLKFQCQPLYFILDKPERGLNVQNVGIVL